MKKQSAIDSLLQLAEEIQDLRTAKELLWELYLLADRKIDLGWPLRSKISDCLGINEDE